MQPLRPSPLVDLRLPGPGGEPPRGHPRQPHPPSTVALVGHLIQTTPLTHRDIAARTGVDKGTVSRWSARHGWTRPPGAAPRRPRPDDRYVPNVVGRALASRLRVQAERLVSEIEAAERVDPAALGEAIALLERARAEQRVRRSRRLVPTETSLARQAERFAKADGRCARRVARAARRRMAEEQRLLDLPLPSPHLPPAGEERYIWTWDRSESARQGWKRRYANMREAGWTPKKPR